MCKDENVLVKPTIVMNASGAQCITINKTSLIDKLDVYYIHQEYIR